MSTAAESKATTIAALIARSEREFADQVAARHKQEGGWRDVTYAELGGVVREIALGLIALGIKPGERMALLAGTRPEWSYFDLAATSAGIVVVPIYQTNSPEECHWVLHDSGACAIVCEDSGQLAKIAQIAETLPELRLVMSMTEAPGGGTGSAMEPVTLGRLRALARSDGDPGELERRREAVKPEDIFTIIYTSGTTGPPKGCVLTHANYRSIVDSVEEARLLSIAAGERDDLPDVIYLYLPLAHSFALLIQLVAFDLGQTLIYFGGDTKQIIAELAETKPTYLPSVPRIFEKVYTIACGAFDAEYIAKITAIGLRVREAEAAGEQIDAETRAAFDEADQKVFKNVRTVFGGRLREAVSGAAPISKEILAFFFASGVPVMEGYGMTETATAATISTPREHRFGSIGKPMHGVEVKIAADGELLIRGRNVFAGYYNNDDASFGAVIDGWLHTGDLGSVDEDGYVYIVGRKKDIIITAGGKNITPANLENEMKQSRWIAHAVMFGDRRPYPVMLITLDAEEIIPWAASQGLPTNLSALVREPKLSELLQAELDRVNSHYAQVEQVKRFGVLDHEFTQEGGELTPSLKVKRAFVAEKYAQQIEDIYAEAG